MTAIDGRLKCEKLNTANLGEDRAFVDTENRCLQDSPFGPVYYRDGAVRVFNPRLYTELNLFLQLPSCPPWESL